MFCPWSRPWLLKMDSLHVMLLVLGLVCVISVQTGYGDDLQCYVCNSAEEYEGGDCENSEKLEQFLKNCTAEGLNAGVEYRYCRKLTQSFDNEIRVIRQCATTGRLGPCVDRTGTKAIKITYCECEGPRCNSANSFSMSMLFLTVSSALLALICHS